MSTVAPDRSAPPLTSRPEPAAPVPATAPSGDPAVLGLPIFVVGSVALGLALVGYVPAAAGASALPIILAGTGLGLVISAIWAATLGQTMVACIFGLFAGFWLSYGMLVLGLGHNWFLIPTANVSHSVTLFEISWAVVMGMLTVATLRLPLAFTVIVGLVVLALVLLIIGTLDTSTAVTKAAGYVTFVFAAVGAYAFLGAASAATGGTAYPLGPPLMK